MSDTGRTMPRMSAARPPTAVPPSEGQTLKGESLLARYVNLVKLPHTVFALPFALLGVVYASRANPVTAREVVLVLLAFTAARFGAMGFNRIVDRRLDAANPRTAKRELPSGRLGVGQAAVAVLLAALAFGACVSFLSRSSPAFLVIALDLPTHRGIRRY